jgi:hypothetical protein
MPIRARILSLILLLACSGLIFASCSSSDQAALAGLIETLTPTPTIDPSGYQAVAPASCLVNEWNTLQSEQRRGSTMNWLQGDLLAWRPGQATSEGELAYLAPNDRSSWFTGALTLARGKTMEEHIPLAPGILVSGDLTWSPGGSWLAFIAFRPNESLYTVMAVSADGSTLVDLFPTDLARTDNRSSQKAILGWRSDTTVQVISSCGEECRNAYDIDVTAPPGPVMTPTVVDDYTLLRKNLQVSQYILTLTPAEFPKNMRVTPAAALMTTVKWAPDERQVAYLDRRGILWYLNVDEKIHYILELGLRDVYEIQWANTSDTLAIRAEDRIFIFEVPCRQPASS